MKEKLALLCNHLCRVDQLLLFRRGGIRSFRLSHHFSAGCEIHQYQYQDAFTPRR